MKVAFINPPYFPKFSRESRSPGVTKSGTLYWPLFLCYAAGTAEADGNEILLLDAPAMELDKNATLEKIKEFAPDLIICETSTPSIINDLQFVKSVKETYQKPVALMGTHASAEPLETLSMGTALDFCIIGEADCTIRDLIRHLRGDGAKNLSEIAGLAWRTPDGSTNFQPEGQKIQNLTELPWVSKTYHKHLYSCYKKYFYGANLNPLVVILAGRGCPYRCTYCVLPQTMNGHVYRKRDYKDVVDELEYIKENFKDLGEVFFEDDTFTADKENVKAFCEEILKRNLKITWSCNARADVPEDLLFLMKRAGCRELCVGFESASEEVLNSIRKGLKQSGAIPFMKAAKKAKILIHGCFMVGNLGDTKQTLEDTLKYAKKLSPNTAQFYPIMAYPGTIAYEDAVESGDLVSKNYNQWLDKDGYHRTTISRPGLSSQELVDFCDRARREFYLRPKYLLQQSIAATFNKAERKRLLRGFGIFYKHLFRKHGKVN
ncbi:MAG: B12-binding domain-containing radical SAM protein [Fibromonadaceae bacterium]|nr:B12-binding domain-containing radical SAM protein [Fibromonadaceae bacterium]